MRYRTNRRDNGSKELEQYAKDLGFVIYSESGAIDAFLAWGQKITAVEWKAPNGTLTPRQAKLIASGFPVRFISKPEQIDQLRAELMRGR